VRLIVSVPRVEAKGGGKELRLVWAWSDAGPQALPANPEEAKSWFTKGAPVDNNLGSGVVLGQSSTFYGVKDGVPVGLSGNGIPVYGPRDPEGAIALYIAVYEIDNEYASLAEEIEKARQMQGAVTLISALASTAFGPLVQVIDAIPGVLRARGKPDLFMQFQHTGFEENLYSLPPKVGEWHETTRSTDKVSMTVRFELYPDSLDEQE
jgi:hypothetical protein